jgi:hypothetical protein
MRQPRPGLLFLLPALLLVALWPAMAGAAALGNEAFTVRDVPVDATAATAAAARDNALADGQERAFALLIQRLTVGDAAARLPKLDSADLSNLVAGFEVEEEKNSDVRYIAKLAFHFKPQPIQDLLRQAGISFAATASRPLLVLPVLQQDGKALLWDDPNPWRAAWVNLPPAPGLVPFMAPIGDLKDMSDITTDQVVKEDVDHMLQIAQRYGAGAALVVTAAARQQGAKLSLDVVAVRYDTGLKQAFPVIALATQVNETPDQLFARAAQAVEQEVAERWKQDNLLHFDHPEQLVVSVPIASLDDWLKVRERLGRVTVVSKVELMSLTHKEATVELQYFGDPVQLKQALGLNELALSDDEGQAVLRLGGQANAAPSQ